MLRAAVRLQNPEDGEAGKGGIIVDCEPIVGGELVSFAGMNSGMSYVCSSRFWGFQCIENVEQLS